MKNKAMMDDLNVLYVAMTPQATALHFTEQYKDLKGMNSLSKFIDTFLMK